MPNALDAPDPEAAHHEMARCKGVAPRQACGGKAVDAGAGSVAHIHLQVHCSDLPRLQRIVETPDSAEVSFDCIV